MKKFIKVRDLAEDGTWRDVLCEKFAENDNGIVYEPMRSHLEICGNVYCNFDGESNAVYCLDNQLREVVWQADELPV